MIYAYFTLLVALVISAIAEFYSIVGLTTIFSASFWPIVVMGGALGIGKITAAVWLKLNWDRAPFLYKLYLVPAVGFLMFLTSIGCFGYLSKAHSDQNLVLGDVVSKLAVYNEKIKIANENIEANRRILKQLDESVEQMMSRTSDERGIDKSVQIRKSQQKDRTRIQNEISMDQQKIATLKDEMAPLSAELRKVENETGPIKYIAAMIYGDNPDSNLLESAIRIVIIMIVAVFDPLALVLILAAQQSMKWEREKNNNVLSKKNEILTKEEVKEDNKNIKEEINQKMNMPENKISSFTQEAKESDNFDISKHPYLFKVSGKRHPPNIELAGHQVYYSETSDSTLNCNKCGTELVNVTNLGSFCPNSECSSELTLPEPTSELNEASTEKNIITKEKSTDIIEEYLKLKPDTHLPSSSFGTKFPVNPKLGDLFVRVDSIPNKVYKYNGTQWILIDRESTDSYLYNDDYIEFLINKLESREYDVEMLTDYEKDQIRSYLKRFQKNSIISG